MRRNYMAGYNMSSSVFLKCPKEEEQQVPEYFTQFADTTTKQYTTNEDIAMEDDKFECLFDEKKIMLYGDLMEELEFHHHHRIGDQYKVENNSKSSSFSYEDEEDEGDDEKRSLCLKLNYEKVMDAWSDRGLPWPAHHEVSHSTYNGYYATMGEVPVMEVGERIIRREASVLRYKEKRQTRLFSNKIRYQVRKFNADNRPRLKGRFVKRNVSS